MDSQPYTKHVVAARQSGLVARLTALDARSVGHDDHVSDPVLAGVPVNRLCHSRASGGLGGWCRFGR